MSKSSPNMTDSENAKCHSIIHSAAVAAGAVGAGLAQLPLSDNLVIMPIQIGMVGSLGNVFGKTLGESAITSLISAAAGTVVGRSASQALLGWIPGVGNVINASTAFTITEAIGWSIANNFAIERRREEEEDRRSKEEVTPISVEEALSSSEEAYRERVTVTMKNRISRIISGIITSVKRAVLFVCFLPKAVVCALWDIAISVKKFVLLLLGLVFKPFRVIPLLCGKLWDGIRALLRNIVNAGWTLGGFAIFASLVLFIVDKLNLLPPEYQSYLSLVREILDIFK